MCTFRFHPLNSLVCSRSVDQVASSDSVMALATRSLSHFFSTLLTRLTYVSGYNQQ